MGGKDEANQHWDTLRKLINKLMKECLADATEMVKDPSLVPYDQIALLAGHLFDARWEAFKHDNDAGLFEE